METPPPDLPVIQVRTANLVPNECPINERIDLAFDFSTDKPLINAVWRLKFIIDVSYRRHVVELTTLPARDFPVGDHHVEFHVPSLDTTGFKQDTLLNVGMLTASLNITKDGADLNILDFNMVTQIMKKGGQLIRSVLNPLDE
eukprot:GAFH01006096.1.p1 GENE.GAFH01006096.1~~GAFH01006096.1.p1  ORF type:complete len:151 (+),score=24.58 GAFH01006096.1:26-454(+)